jgi:hypothetical protein
MAEPHKEKGPNLNIFQFCPLPQLPRTISIAKYFLLDVCLIEANARGI